MNLHRDIVSRQMEEFIQLQEVNITICFFQGINFTGANLSKLDLRYVNFKYAILKNANLSGANLSYCNFERADLTKALLDVSTQYCHNLSNMPYRGRHTGPGPTCNNVTLRMLI